MSGPTLLAVAHGSRDPRAAATIRALADQVERLAPVLDLQVGYLQHGEPSLSEALDSAGPDVVIVPLLLSTGYHLTTDIEGAATVVDTAITASGAAPLVAGPLGPDQLLVTALAGRLAEAGVPPGTPVVLAAAGSSDPAAAAEVATQADLLAAELKTSVVAAFAATGERTVSDALARLRSATRGPVAVASYLLAPGTFADRLRTSGADWVSEPLGDHPAVAALIIDRYRTARTVPKAA